MSSKMVRPELKMKWRPEWSSPRALLSESAMFAITVAGFFVCLLAFIVVKGLDLEGGHDARLVAYADFAANRVGMTVQENRACPQH